MNTRAILVACALVLVGSSAVAEPPNDPRQARRIFIGNNDGWVCWEYGEYFGGKCPNASRVKEWAGNCPY